MNLFILDADPRQAARYHSDRHMLTAIQETLNILMSAHVMCDGKTTARTRVGAGVFVKHAAQVNHPVAVWARTTSANYDWLAAFYGQLIVEFSLRYRRMHVGEGMADLMKRKPLNVPLGELTPFAQCMPAQYKRADAVAAYRLYYFMTKKELAQWMAPAVVPLWWRELEAAPRLDLSTAHRQHAP